ncbi:MAG TPA: hypothetical protein VM238_15255 [Phycisphaerae bacterium]|nr:hypothetical protein [Phycisphaerae bacterium]
MKTDDTTAEGALVELQGDGTPSFGAVAFGNAAGAAPRRLPRGVGLQGQ